MDYQLSAGAIDILDWSRDERFRDGTTFTSIEDFEKVLKKLSSPFISIGTTKRDAQKEVIYKCYKCKVRKCEFLISLKRMERLAKDNKTKEHYYAFNSKNLVHIHDQTHDIPNKTWRETKLHRRYHDKDDDTPSGSFDYTNSPQASSKSIAPNFSPVYTNPVIVNNNLMFVSASLN